MNNNPQMAAIIIVILLLIAFVKYTNWLNKKYSRGRIKYQEDKIHTRLINGQEPSKKLKP